MYEINQDDFPDDFRQAWCDAGSHINQQGQEGVKWLRSNLIKPIAEHLSFLLGNQLVFVFVEINSVPFSGSAKDLFINAALEASAIPCVLKMEQKVGGFEPVFGGWGFKHALTDLPINPTDLVSNEDVEMSNWELHDFAIKTVCSHLEKEGHTIYSSQSSLHIAPSIWFQDKHQLNWVIVRAVRYPNKTAPRPTNLDDMKKHYAKVSESGYFASVSVANGNDPFDPMAEKYGNFLPLFRGGPLFISFSGLESL